MPNFIAFADLEPKDRFGIVVARWNEAITRKLLDGAVAKLHEKGVPEEMIDVATARMAAINDAYNRIMKLSAPRQLPAGA